eukprot:GHUV01010048.1.p1 GENE.GHUV01010048.1~~GHUV01010048.1.p1  ORF type:complete len:478 (+),score=174.07 GHUV01010048.1:287-1720(+)
MTPMRAGVQRWCQSGQPPCCCLQAQFGAQSFYSRRATTREKAWERIVAMLRNGVRQDDCFQSASTLTSRCLSAIRKGGAAEAAFAATALALLTLTMGEPSESAFQEVYPDLLKAAKHGKGVAVKVAAVEAAAICCFVSSEDEHTTIEVMEDLQKLWNKDSPKLKAAALRGWAFLYTSLNSPLSSKQLDSQLAALAALLHDPDVEVRQAAGEGLALLYNTCGLAECDEQDYDDDDVDEYLPEEDGLDCEQQQEGSSEPAAASAQVDLAPAGEAVLASPAQAAEAAAVATPLGNDVSSRDNVVSPAAVVVSLVPGQPLGPGVIPARRAADEMSTCSSVSGLDMVMDRVKELANNRGDRQRRNKRERVALKGCFREMRKIMEDGHVPEQKIKLRHGDTLIISTMEGNTMMNYFKRFIAGGFQVHLQENPFLHGVFDFTPLEGRQEKLSAQEKRFFRSPSSAVSKARSQERKSQRSHKGVW